MRFPGIRIERRILMIGEMMTFNRGSFPKIGKIRASRRRKPNLFKKISTSRAFFKGKSPIKIFPPSKG